MNVAFSSGTVHAPGRNLEIVCCPSHAVPGLTRCNASSKGTVSATSDPVTCKRCLVLLEKDEQEKERAKKAVIWDLREKKPKPRHLTLVKDDN